MLYLYHEEAKKPQIDITGDAHRYLFKVRRHKAGEQIHLRNLKDNEIYCYEISHIDKRSALLSFVSAQPLRIEAPRYLHIGWCMIDPKSIEKLLPSLNEIGVAKITFIYCDRSQKSFKTDIKRFRKILLNSSQQSGRSVMMEIETMEGLESFAKAYPDAKLLDFSDNRFVEDETFQTIVIGCEGGFTTQERALFSEKNIVGFKTPLILRSESAACAVAAKVLL